MASAIEETNRRREKQIAYNAEHGIDPQPLRKKIGDITDMLAREDADTKNLLAATGDHRRRGVAVPLGQAADAASRMPSGELASLIDQLSEQMHQAAEELQFELAARLRDEISELKKELRGMLEAGA